MTVSPANAQSSRRSVRAIVVWAILLASAGVAPVLPRPDDRPAIAASAIQVSGSVRDADGAALAGVTVRAQWLDGVLASERSERCGSELGRYLCAGWGYAAANTSTNTDANGTYVLWAPSNVRVFVTATAHLSTTGVDARDCTIPVPTNSLGGNACIGTTRVYESLDADTTVDLAFDQPVATQVARWHLLNGEAVGGALGAPEQMLTTRWTVESSQTSASVAPGVRRIDYINNDFTCRPDAAGECRLFGFEGWGTGATVSLALPADLPITEADRRAWGSELERFVPSMVWSWEGRGVCNGLVDSGAFFGGNVPLRFPAAETVSDYVVPYSEAESAGIIAGEIRVCLPGSVSLSDVTVTPLAAFQSDVGLVAPVGQLGYQVSGIPLGATIAVLISLPAGAAPDGLLKTGGEGFVEAPFQRWQTGVALLRLTDGGAGDEDGVVNGVIVDPVVPVAFPRGGNAGSLVTVSAARATPVFGQRNVMIARVTGADGKRVLSGTVRFVADLKTDLGAAPLRNGVARLLVSGGLASGAHTIRAVHDDGGSLAIGVSEPASVLVSRAQTKMAIKGPSAAAPGMPVVFAAAIRTKAPGRGVATGSVIFRDGDQVLGAAQLDQYGVAAITVTLAAGAHVVTAAYNGDEDHEVSMSARSIAVR